MTPIETVGLIASIIAIFEAGYLAGKWQAAKRRRGTLDEAVADRIRTVLGAVEIRRVTCNAEEAKPAQTIRIFYDIVSRAEFPYQVWLGASVVAANGMEYFDQSQDKEITLEPGPTSESRYLTLSANAHAGTYSLHGAIWLGARAAPRESILLARTTSSEILRLK
jgi:hypothetical protein